MAKKKPVEITPDVTLFGKLGARSRAFPMVVTELIDNSLDSWILMPSKYKRASGLKIEIEGKEGQNPWFTIKDNAGGMTREELISALTVAKSTKTNNSKVIGSFGLGLKSACMYIGPKFRIYTQSYREKDIINYVEFDREKFEASGKWELDFETISLDEALKVGVYFKEKHGTEIRVQGSRYRSANKNGIINRVQSVFAPRLPQSNKLKIKPIDEETTYGTDMVITFNDQQLIASGPFYEFYNNKKKYVEDELKRRKREFKKTDNKELLTSTDYIKGRDSKDEDKACKNASIIPFSIDWLVKIPGVKIIPPKKINGKVVKGRVGILDRGMSHQNKYGFDLIKNGRVIESNVLDKDIKGRDIGLAASNHNARIAGQLFLDDWEADHQKTSFLKDSEDWEELTKYISKQVKEFLPVSSGLQNANKILKEQKIVDEDENDEDVIADERFEEKVEDINKGIQKTIKGSSSFKEQIKELEAKRKEEEEKFAAKKILSNGPSKKKESTTTLMKTKPIIEKSRMGKNSPLMKTEVNKNGNNVFLKLILNRDHPFLAKRESAELSAIGEFLAIDYYTSYILKNKTSLKHEDFVVLRDTLLKELGQKLR